MGLLNKIQGKWLLLCAFQICAVTLFAQGWPWASALQSNTSLSVSSIAIDGMGNSYVTGYFENSADLGNGIILAGAGMQDIFVAKYNAVGTPIWAKSGGMALNDFGHEIFVTSSGDLYVTGAFIDSLRLQTATGSTIVYSVGESDIFLTQLDPNTGNALWLTSAGSPSRDEGTSVTVIGTNVFVTGFVEANATFGTLNLGNFGLSDAFVACYNTVSASWTWALNGGTAAEDAAWSICDDGASLYMTGKFNGAVFNFGTTNLSGLGQSDGFITKLDQTGSTIWSSCIRGTGQNDIPTSIASDGSDIYVTGNTDGVNPIQFSGMPSIAATPAGGMVDFWVGKFAGATGHVLWALTQGDVGADSSTSIIVSNPGQVMIAGAFENMVTLAGNTYSGPGMEAFLETFDANSGVALSAVSASGSGNAMLNDLAAYNACGVIAVGRYDQTIDFSTNQLSSASGWNGLIALRTNPGLQYPLHDVDSTSICMGDTLTIHILGGVSNVSWESSTDGGITWQSVMGQSGDSLVAIPTQHTIYRSQYSGPCALGMDSSWVQVGGGATVAFNGLPDSSCLGGNPILFQYTPINPMGSLTFTGAAFTNLGNGLCSFDPSIAGVGLHSIHYDYSDSLLCRQSAADSITVYTVAPVSFSGLAAAYCLGDTNAHLLTGSQNSNATFWADNGSLADNGNGTANFYPASCAANDSVLVTFLVNDSNGCSAADSQWTYLSGILADAGPDFQICEGDSVVLGTNAVPGQDYLWSEIGTNWTSIAAQPSLFPANSGIFSLIVRNGYGCTDVDTVEVSVIPFPNVDAGIDRTICQGDSVRLGGSIPQGYASLWQSDLGYQSNLSNPAAFPLQTETFYLSLSDTTAGCTSTDSVQITVVLPAAAADAGPDQFVTTFGPVTLNGSDPFPGQGFWTCAPAGLTISNPQSATATLDIQQNGSWTMVWQVQNAPCPASRDSMTITLTRTELNLPTGFSPNDDQVNDLLIFEGLEAYPNNKLHVFNRWGVELCTFAPYRNDWNGTNQNGQPLVEDTYYYVLELENGNSVNRYLVLKR